MQRRAIGIYIGAEQKGFLVSLGKLLSRDHDVRFIARDRDVSAVIKRNAPELSEKTMVLDAYRPQVAPRQIVEEALERERRYGETLCMLMSFDRALGQGYLFNADRHPHVIRSTWPYEKKLKDLLERFIIFEKIVEECPFDLLLGHDRPIFLHLIARYRGARYLTLGLSRYEDRYMWFENYYEEKETYSRAIQKCLLRGKAEKQEIPYRPYTQYSYTAASLDYSYVHAVKRAAYIFAQQIYVRLRGTQPRDSYVFCGWIPPLFRSPYNYSYVQREGVTPNSLTNYRLAYFPLHQEPESSLLNISPEFNNTMEVISWVSKSLPADTVLVVKENPWSFGVRSRWFYRNLVKIPNVVLAHPIVPSHEWIEKSRMVVSITGTAGFEAVYFHRPVLSFGKHQVINLLPTVKYADSFMKTRESIQEILELGLEDVRLHESSNILHRALMDASFPLPGYERLYKSSSLHLDIGRIAVDRLYQEYQDLFG